MKIDPPAPPAVPFTRSSKSGSATTASTGATSAPKENAASGQVHLMPGVPGGDFDAARVAAIREDIRAGRYQVNPEGIADGLLDSVRDLLGSKKD